MENERKELLIARDQNSKLLIQLQDGADRELLLKQKSSALNTSISNLHKDLRDVNTLNIQYFCIMKSLYLLTSKPNYFNLFSYLQFVNVFFNIFRHKEKLTMNVKCVEKQNHYYKS